MAFAACGVRSRFDFEVVNREWESVPTAERVLEQQPVERRSRLHAVDGAADDGGVGGWGLDGEQSLRVGPGDEADRGYSSILPQQGSPQRMTKKRKKR